MSTIVIQQSILARKRSFRERRPQFYLTNLSAPRALFYGKKEEGLLREEGGTIDSLPVRTGNHVPRHVPLNPSAPLSPFVIVRFASFSDRIYGNKREGRARGIRKLLPENASVGIHPHPSVGQTRSIP